jgi:plastocyanin
MSIIQRVAKQPFYVRTALFGLAIYLAAVASFFIGVLLLDPAELPAVVFLLVPALIVASALLILRRLGFAAAIPASGFGLLVFSEDIDVVLTTPYSFLDFAGTIVVFAGLVIVLVASVLGLAESFRGEPRLDSKRWERVGARGTVAALAAVAVVSAVATGLHMTDRVAAADKEQAFTVTARKVAWQPGHIEARAGEPLKLVVRNNDPLLHTFTIHGRGIDVRLGPYSEKLIVIDGSTGDYAYVCDVFGHGSEMTGIIQVR